MPDNSGNQGLTLKLLAIERDPSVLETIQVTLAEEKVGVLTARDAPTGLSLFSKTRPRIVLLDLQLPQVNGLEVLEEILTVDPATDVILITARYSTESAIEAIRKGARDYLAKPLEPEKLRQRIRGLVREAEERQKVFQLEQELVDGYQLEGIIGRSPAILQLFAKLRIVAPHFRTVLVTGATGTGKELIARALHRLSPAASGPLAVCDCSALVETLVESELFGHVRGAFTGATQDRAGMFEHASGGTVFLDEIGELTLSAQARLLRVLQDRELRRVGSPAVRTVDVRVVAATHRDLRALVASGRFREDLYYRLSMIEIELPRLADRPQDLPLLQRHFLNKFARQYQKEIRGITRRAQALLARYSWPGNVRELENVIGNACMMATGNAIDVHDLPESLRGVASSPDAGDPDLITLEELQRRHLLRVLDRVGGNKARAAEVLGVSRATVYDMLAKMKAAQAARTNG